MSSSEASESFAVDLRNITKGYSMNEKTFMDVRVTHPNWNTNAFKTLTQIYQEHEKAKKDVCEERVSESEKG